MTCPPKFGPGVMLEFGLVVLPLKLVLDFSKYPFAYNEFS